jgi:hypothetical protein
LVLCHRQRTGRLFRPFERMGRWRGLNSHNCINHLRSVQVSHCKGRVQRISNIQ